jgi:hypothetical protein
MQAKAKLSEVLFSTSHILVSANPINQEKMFAELAIEHWRQLGEELKADVEQYVQTGGSASFSQPAEGEYRVGSSDSGLEVRIVADPSDRIARYDFLRTNDLSAGAPEGGIFSMRVGHNNRVEFYSSDQELQAEEARKLLLDPVLAPAA